MKTSCDKVWTDQELLATGRAVLFDEARELQAAADRLGMELVEAARLIHRCKGRVVVVGLGKSGLIGRKIAATLASLGTPAFFLHAAEGVHGDLGMVRPEDVGLFISNSGETREVLELIPFFRRIGAAVVAFSGRSASRLAREADVVLLTTVTREADPLRSSSPSAMPWPPWSPNFEAFARRISPSSTPGAPWGGSCCFASKT